MKNKFYHISTYSVMRYWTILWMAILSFSCSDFNPMDSYSRIPPDRNTDIDDGDEGDGAGGLFEKGYGTVNKPYLVMDVIQIQNMSEALVKGIRADNLIGAGMALTVEWNGVLASYLGVLTNADILKADLFRNLQVVWTVQTGLSQMENGKTALMNQRQEILSSLIGKATVQQTTLVS